MKKSNKRLFKVATVVGSIVFAFMSFVTALSPAKTVSANEGESTANVTLPYTIQTTNWGTAPTYGAITKITVNPVEETLKDGNKLYGYKLSSETPYSSTVTSGNTTTPFKNAVTGEEVVNANTSTLSLGKDKVTSSIIMSCFKLIVSLICLIVLATID